MAIIGEMSGSEEENRRMIKEREEDRDLVMDDDDDASSSDDDSSDDDFSPDFKNHIKSTKLNWRRLKPMAAWVFWSENAVEFQSPPTTTQSSGCVPNSVPETLIANEKVTDKIRSVIQKLLVDFERDNFGVLIQLWIPTRDGDRCVLTTADQPFGVCKSIKEFFDFRIKCLKNYKCYVDAESVDAESVLGHVFRQNELAFTPDITYYSSEEYSQRYDALKSFVRTSMAFPVIEPSTRCCVGVLELLFSTTIWCNSYIRKVNEELQVAGLKSTDAFGHAFPSVECRSSKPVLEEISKGMKVVCETHKLLMGRIWTPCRCCRDAELGGSCSRCYVSCKGRVMATCPWRQASYALDKDMQKFVHSCTDNLLRTGHGVGGRALLFYSPCFCKDVTRFRKTEYPLVHLARMYGLTSCFAICLRSNYTGDVDYVMEFFLPPNNNGGRVPRTLLYSILATMKQHFPSFKVASGEELGQELSIEVIKISKDRRPGDSFQICQITMSTPTLALQNAGDTVQLDSTNQQLMAEADAINNERNVVGPEQNNSHDVVYSENNERNVVINSTNQQLMVEADAINNERNVAIDSVNQQLMVEADVINNEGNVVGPEQNNSHDDIYSENNDRNVAIDLTNQQLMVEVDAIDNERNVVGPKQNNGHDVIYSENNGFERTSKRRKTRNDISYGDLKQCFGMRLEEASKLLGVSRSTFKRLCRDYNILYWKGKKRKRNGCLTKLNQPEEPLEQMVIGNEGASHDLRNLCAPPTAAEACPQVSKLELHMAEMSMAPRLESDAVISTRPEASVRGAFTMSIGTTIDSGNLSPAKKAGLHEWEQKLQRAVDGLPENSLSDCHFPTIQSETPIENVVNSKDAESCCPSAREACMEEETAESNSNNYPRLGTTPTLALQSVGEMVQLDSTNQQLMVEADAINNEKNAKDVYRTQLFEPISYVNEFPEGLRPFIRHVEDVLADGNCGFRAIAGLLGLGEDNWQQVRSNLIIELHSYVTHYKELFGSVMIDELTRSLSYSESCVNIDRWMTMPEMGHLIASCYNVVLYHLSMHQCLTFLPLRSISVPTPKRREICIGFVKGNHFVKVFLLPGHPVPPIANKWIKFHYPCASGWDNTYISRIKHFQQIVSSNVATRENIDLD